MGQRFVRSFAASLLVIIALLPGGASADDYGPFSREDLITYELRDMQPEAAQPFADALARSEVLSDVMAEGFQHQSPQRALVLYDWSDDIRFARNARMSAIMVRNLLGHFDLEVHLHRVNNYQSGQMSAYDLTIYIGEVFNNPLPAAFLRDARDADQTLVWMQHNLHQLDQLGTGTLQRRGLMVEPLADEAATATGRSRPSFFDTVFYRGLPFVKFVGSQGLGQPPLYDPLLIYARPVGATQTLVEIGNSQTGMVRPYILRNDNFWYFADVPLSFFGPRDRYVVLADILHDIVGVDHPRTHQAMLRIEDLHSMVNLEGYNRLVSLLGEYDVPYSLAIIPEYREVANDGSVNSIPFNARGARPFRERLLEAIEGGAVPIMHGVTHQYGDRPNPETGLTGIDYEFWDVVADRPVEDDSISWAVGRLQNGIDILDRAGIETNIYEVPHYLGSPSSYLASTVFFPFSYHRVTYYGAAEVGPDTVDESPVYEMQFFPYLIHDDHYGQLVIPENLGNLQYTPPVQSADFLLRNAAYGLAVRDGVASLFVHSFLFVPYNGIPAHTDFSRVLSGISDMGYEWVNPHEYLEMHGIDSTVEINRTGSN